MKTGAIAGVEATPPVPHRFTPRLPRIVHSFAGPALIVLCVLVVVRGVAFGDLLPRGDFDILGQWLPWFCFLGRSLRAGHIPAWNPHVMGGMPFAPDPQTGWLNLSAMTWFSALPCGSALHAYLVFQPILAGLGIYGFSRSEGLSRAAATVGGLALGVSLAGSKYFDFPWASGSIAWTAILLAAASRYLHAPSWRSRLFWLVPISVAWGQVATAHFSHGLVIGTFAVAVFVLASVINNAVHKRTTLKESALVVALLAVAVPLIDAAILLPRARYISRTALSLGYRKLDALSLAMSGGQGDGGAVQLFPTFRLPWPLSFAFSPGLCVGAAALVLSVVAFASRRRRHLALAFGLVGAVFYVLTLTPVIRTVVPVLGASPLGNIYEHAPRRFAIAVFLVVPFLAAVGAETLRESVRPAVRFAVLVLGGLLWIVLPPLFGAEHARLSVFVLGIALAIPALAAAALRPMFLVVVPLALAAQLIANGIAGEHLPRRAAYPRRAGSLLPPATRAVDLSSYLKPGILAGQLRARRGDRYLTVAPKRWSPWGYVSKQRPVVWPMLGMQQSMLFDLEEGQGYETSQPLRSWMFVRTVEPKQIRYEVGYFKDPPPIALDLLNVRWIIGEIREPPPLAGLVKVATEGEWVLYELPNARPRASLVTSWRVAGSPGAALDAVADPTFDPAREVVLERSPPIARSPKATPNGSVSYRARGAQAAEVDVNAPFPALVLVRNSYDPNWRASVDGHEVRVLAADYLVQGIPVPAGRHRIRLWYQDDSIGYGLLASGLSLGALAMGMLLLSPAFRRRLLVRFGAFGTRGAFAGADSRHAERLGRR